MKIHFIGIGGIGVSALAKYYLSEGFLVSGSDLAESEVVEELRRVEAKIFTSKTPLDLLPERRPSGRSRRHMEDPSMRPAKRGACSGNNVSGHRKENLPSGTNLVVYSAAVTKDNPELVEARNHGIKCQTYAQALGDLTKKYFTIAVSGTHGKSTTTAMIALIMVEAGLDPTVIVGTKVKWEMQNPSRPSFKKGGAEISNFRAGKSKYLVIEADEYASSFLNYWPKIIVLTNIEEDHLDYYKNLKNILKAFKEYTGHLPKDGVLVVNGEDGNILKISGRIKSKVIFYSSSEPRTGGTNREVYREGKVLDSAPAALRSNDKMPALNLMVPGRHNLMNALAAISAVRILGISDSISVKALNKFNGTWRRFEYKGEINGAKIFDDYGHHPTEIKATLRSAAEVVRALSARDNVPEETAAKGNGNVGSGKLWVIFQPHQYQRTFALFNQFVGAFDEADIVIILPIYSVAGREKESIKKKVSSEKLVSAIKSHTENPSTRPANRGACSGDNIIYIGSFEKTAEYLRKNLKPGDIAVVMGAGDVFKLTEKLIKLI